MAPINFRLDGSRVRADPARDILHDPNFWGSDDPRVPFRPSLAVRAEISYSRVMLSQLWQHRSPLTPYQQRLAYSHPA